MGVRAALVTLWLQKLQCQTLWGESSAVSETIASRPDVPEGQVEQRDGAGLVERLVAVAALG
jgi:hypothetical protein